MWQIWTSGILGLWVILLAFLNFSSTLTTFFLIATGAALAVLNFWMLSLIKVPKRRYPDSEILPPAPSELEDETPTLNKIEVEVTTSGDVEEENEEEQESEDNALQNN